MISTLTAARAQMVISFVFHIVFAAVGIGLPLLMMIAEGLYLRTGKAHYRELAGRWAKLTGLLFAVGAISGTALSVELGLLWPRYVQIMGAVVGHIFGLEGYAFFVEAIFLGLYLYGGDRLSPKAHWWCGVAIAISGAASGWLVLGVNAWMQLPVGFNLDAAGRVVVSDPIAIFKRYGWFVMAGHSTLSCYVAVSFAMAGAYAVQWLRGRRDDYARAGITIAMAVGAGAAILQPLSGDLLAKFVFKTQPAKFAAMEAHFETGSHAPVVIGGIPDVAAGTTRFGIRIPSMLSILADHRPDTVVTGLNDIPRENWPSIGVTHAAFDVMVGLGTLLPAISLWFWLIRWRRGAVWTFERRWLLRALAICGPMGFIALEAGWIVTEVGRQPWVINGVLRTADAVTDARSVLAVFFLFTALYILLAATVLVYLRRLAQTPPQQATVTTK